jgi:RNA 2',3'-cyclic 3'-phosphodiesterase
MRLFTAIDISPECRAALVELLGLLRPAARFQWSPPANLHITTKFIGEWAETELPRLCEALRAVPGTGALPISVNGLGWFPNPHHPRVLFAGIDAPAGLGDLHRMTDQACATLGIPPEQKRYSPHLTLARVRDGAGLPAVRQLIAGLPSTDFGRFDAASFHLYESVPGPGGAQYKKLEEFPLL